VFQKIKIEYFPVVLLYQASGIGSGQVKVAYRIS
jgi:hypothetical protein